MPALLAGDGQVRHAHGLEGLAGELVRLALDFLQAQDVRGLFGDEPGDLIDTQADRVDVPCRD